MRGEGTLGTFACVPCIEGKLLENLKEALDAEVAKDVPEVLPQGGRPDSP